MSMIDGLLAYMCINMCCTELTLLNNIPHQPCWRCVDEIDTFNYIGLDIQ